MTTLELAAAAGCHESYITRMARAGELTHERIRTGNRGPGFRFEFPSDAVERVREVLAERKANAGSKAHRRGFAVLDRPRTLCQRTGRLCVSADLAGADCGVCEQGAAAYLGGRLACGGGSLALSLAGVP